MKQDYGSKKRATFDEEDQILKNGVESVGSLRDIPFRTWLSFLTGIVIMLIAGTGYAFSAWSDDLKNERGYSQTEIELIGALGNTGLYCAAFGGMIFDSFGLRVTSIFGGLLVFAGYILMYTTTRMFTPGLGSSGIQGVVYLVAQFGSITLYISCLSTNVALFPNKYRGLIIGALVSVFGLSATMYTAIYNSVFNSDDLADFQLTMALANLIAGFAGALLMKNLHTPSEPAAKRLMDDEPTKTATSSQTSSGRKILQNLYEKIISKEFWLLFWAFFFGYGAGLLHTNNLGQLTKSLNGGMPADDAVLICVTLFSVFNATGRLGIAAISDRVPIKRGWFFVFSMLLMTVGQFVAALVFKEDSFTKVYVLTAVIGMAYGGLGSIAPTLSSDLWGTENFAQNWGWILIGAAGASYVFNGAAGGFYDREAINHPGMDANECAGEFCFKNAYFLSSGLMLFGLIISIILAPRTKHPSQRIRLESVAV